MPSDSGDLKQPAAASAFGGATPAPAQSENIPCPRCGSTNTKFCYYNNYNLSQPRHFCKSCRRYWTQGGTLRNVPVGGGSRKNSKRSRHAANNNNISSSSSTSSCFTLSDSNVKVIRESDCHEANGSFTKLLSSQG